MANLIYRALGPADLEDAHALSKAVGWPHRLEDWTFIMQLGSGIGASEPRSSADTGNGPPGQALGPAMTSIDVVFAQWLLGKEDRVRRLAVRWPAGTRASIESPTADRYHNVAWPEEL